MEVKALILVSNLLASRMRDKNERSLMTIDEHRMIFERSATLVSEVGLMSLMVIKPKGPSTFSIRNAASPSEYIVLLLSQVFFAAVDT